MAISSGDLFISEISYMHIVHAGGQVGFDCRRKQLFFIKATAHLVTGTVRTYGALSDTINHGAHVS